MKTDFLCVLDRLQDPAWMCCTSQRSCASACTRDMTLEPLIGCPAIRSLKNNELGVSSKGKEGSDSLLDLFKSYNRVFCRKKDPSSILEEDVDKIFLSPITFPKVVEESKSRRASLLRDHIATSRAQKNATFGSLGWMYGGSFLGARRFDANCGYKLLTHLLRDDRIDYGFFLKGMKPPPHERLVQKDLGLYISSIKPGDIHIVGGGLGVSIKRHYRYLYPVIGLSPQNQAMVGTFYPACETNRITQRGSKSLPIYFQSLEQAIDAVGPLFVPPAGRLQPAVQAHVAAHVYGESTFVAQMLSSLPTNLPYIDEKSQPPPICLYVPSDDHIIIFWRLGLAYNVKVAGTFSRPPWNKFFELFWCPKNQTHWIDLSLVIEKEVRDYPSAADSNLGAKNILGGAIQLKFLVDGTWICSEELAVCIDANGNENNIIIKANVGAKRNDLLRIKSCAYFDVSSVSSNDLVMSSSMTNMKMTKNTGTLVDRGISPKRYKWPLNPGKLHRCQSETIPPPSHEDNPLVTHGDEDSQVGVGQVKSSWPHSILRNLNPDTPLLFQIPSVPDVRVTSGLGFQIGVARIPHPDKKATGGADAFYVSSNFTSFGIADGVGEWDKFGVNPKTFANELMQSTKYIADSIDDFISHRDARIKRNEWFSRFRDLLDKEELKTPLSSALENSIEDTSPYSNKDYDDLTSSEKSATFSVDPVNQDNMNNTKDIIISDDTDEHVKMLQEIPQASLKNFAQPPPVPPKPGDFQHHYLDENDAARQALILLREGYNKTSNSGSSTALIGCLGYNKESRLGVSNLGDSKLILLRRNEGFKFKCIFKTKEQQHHFNCPFQLSRVSTSCKNQTGIALQDNPEMSECSSIPIREGDLIIAGTDGLFDNVFDDEICGLCDLALSPYESILFQDSSAVTNARLLAETLSEAASYRSSKLNFNTPFMNQAQKAGLFYCGGKMDDITVLVCWVVRPSQIGYLGASDQPFY